MLLSRIALAITSLRSRVVFLNMSKKKEPPERLFQNSHCVCYLSCIPVMV